MSKFNLVRPCAGCPFGTGPDSVRNLGRTRAEGIVNDLLDDRTFDCHKTTHGWITDEDTGEEVYVPTGKEEHCAGATILLERIERPNQWMRWMERLGFYDRKEMELDTHLVVRDFDEFIRVQSTGRKR